MRRNNNHGRKTNDDSTTPPERGRHRLQRGRRQTQGQAAQPAPDPEFPGKFVYTATFTRERDVYAALAELAKRINVGQPAKDSAERFSAYLESWITGPLTRSDRSPATQSLYRSLLVNHAAPVLGKMAMKDIIGRDTEALLAKVGKNLAASSVRSLGYALKALFATAIRDRVIATSPMDRVKIPTADSPEARILQPEQIVAVLESIRNQRPIGPFIWFASMTATRRGELLALTWNQVDLDAGLAKITLSRNRVDGFGMVTGPTKNRRNRDLDLPAPLVAVLREVRHQQRLDRLAAGEAYEDSGLVFTNELGHGLDPRTTTDRVRAVLEAHGLSGAGLGPHMLRHTSLSLLLSSGHAVAAVSKLAGHSSSRTTLTTYAHALTRDRDAITETLGALASGQR